MCRVKDGPHAYAALMLQSRSGICSRYSPSDHSVRDRGVGGSNPLAPTNFLRKPAKFSQSEHSVVCRFAGGETECAVLQTTPVSIERPEILGRRRILNVHTSMLRSEMVTLSLPSTVPGTAIGRRYGGLSTIQLDAAAPSPRSEPKTESSGSSSAWYRPGSGPEAACSNPAFPTTSPTADWR